MEHQNLTPSKAPILAHTNIPIKIPMKIPKEALEIIEKLNAKGHAAYLVGGCVRDHLMGVEPKDYDITTSATPELVGRYFKRTYETGVKHGTVTVIIGEKHMEVTTFRLDGEYLDFRHPDEVKFTDDVKEDLSRRDFTMNAIAYHMREGFVDPFGGIEDIRHKLIRGVGEAAARFREDALRMLRALRFSAQLNFELEENTLTALCQNAGLISHVSAERIRDELCKLLLSDNPEKLTSMEGLQLMGHIYKGSDYFQRVAPETAPLLTFSEKDLTLRLAQLLRHMEPKEAESFLKRLKFDNKTMRAVLTLIKFFWNERGFVGNPSKEEKLRYEIKKRLQDYGEEPFENALKLERVHMPFIKEGIDMLLQMTKDIIAKEECFTIGALKINGSRLQELGVPKGRPVGLELERLLDQVMERPELNNAYSLEKLVNARLSESPVNDNQ